MAKKEEKENEVSKTVPYDRFREVNEKKRELLDDLQRVQAEFQNFRRRSVEERGELINLVKQDVILQLLPLIDNIDRALSHLPEDLKDNPWAKGVEQVAKQADETLKQIGVEKIQALGQPFDHNLHEAIAVEDGEGNQEIVSEEVQPGYKMGDKIVRHAMVKVKRINSNYSQRNKEEN